MKSNNPWQLFRRTHALLTLVAATVGSVGCSSSSSPPVETPPPLVQPPAAITLNGVVTDGPVIGGTLYYFSAANIQAALDSVDPDGDRQAALDAAASIGKLTRDPADADQYTAVVGGGLANTPLFLVFDNTDAEDDTFKDAPANLESVVMLAGAGSVQRVNISLQTTLIAQQVRMALDVDGDGTIIDDAAIATALADATVNVLDAVATDALGRDLYPMDFDPFTHDDDDEVHAVSSALGFLLRAAGNVAGDSHDDIIAAIAADTADGIFDGVIPVALAPTPAMEALAESVSEIAMTGLGEELSMFAVGACSSAAVFMARACAVDVIDDLFEGSAICIDIRDDEDRADCLADVEEERIEIEEECEDVFDARLALCDDLDDAAHDPMFGEAFAGNFVDPLQIGNSVPVNPWFPLQTGNHWLYLGDDESIEVTVTDETKLIDGVTCVVVVDVAIEDGEVVEITRDWYAQDIEGNVWYCGEIARNFELFDGDAPETPELVDIDGSWKAGRDGSEPGILLPFNPGIGDVFRQELSYGEAEDVVEILSVTADEAAPGGVCVAKCLMTAETTPLEPEVEENKFYVPGIGLIIEVDTETGERVELELFTPGSAP